MSMNYYEIRPANRSIPASIYCADTTEGAVRLYCWANAYDRDEVEVDDLEVVKVDEDDLSPNERHVIESRNTRYKAAQIIASIGEWGTFDEWWASCPAPIAERLRDERLCVLSLDELFGLMCLPGWIFEGACPLSWTVVKW
jgi:hypothetical protein